MQGLGIPGFRSGRAWKSVIAVIGYLLTALLGISGAATGYMPAVVIALWTLLTCFLITNAWGVRDRCPRALRSNLLVSSLALAGFWIVGFVIFAAVSPPVTKPSTTSQPTGVAMSVQPQVPEPSSRAVVPTPPSGPTIMPPTAVLPTAGPTPMAPTAVPTPVPPTAVPTAVPTPVPPTAVPTAVPPTAVPTLAPTEVPPVPAVAGKPPVPAPVRIYLVEFQRRLDALLQTTRPIAQQMTAMGNQPNLMGDSTWRRETLALLRLYRLAAQDLQGIKNPPREVSSLNLNVLALGSEAEGASNDLIQGIDRVEPIRFRRGVDRLDVVNVRLGQVKQAIAILVEQYEWEG